ncbi:MAG: NAD-dependent epimerase/dehydratase family protein [Ruminococcus sp.]|nr:NAD-dependent epimerase/dehydratase family protein [Ruminococcus sp.]
MSKKILITGENSYVGSMFAEFTTEYGDVVDTIDMIGDDWKSGDFSSYDAVVHVAAIVHKQERKYSKQEYFKVNSELAFKVAQKAKNDGVKQFVFLSTMSVYGVLNGVITKDTPCVPFNLYGESKLKAEHIIRELDDENFTVTVLRPPIVYGKGCKGNYVVLSKFAKKLPLFPDYKSQHSMIYIDNLSAFIKKAIDERLSGVFCPQDDEYVCTADMVQKVAKANSKDIKLTRFFNPFIALALKMKIHLVCKIFGTLIYEKDLCPPYDKVDFETAIEKTET